MFKRMFHALMAFGAVVLTVLLLNILSLAPAMFVNVSPVMAHPGTPEADSDGDGVADDLDSCPDTLGENWNGGCPFSAPPQPTEIPPTPTPIPPTATPNPVSVRNFQSSDQEAVLELIEAEDAPEVEEAVSIEGFNGTSQALVAELQSLELIGEGQIRVQQNYLFLNGRGDLFVGVGTNSPSTNQALGAELTFTSNDPSVFELCSISTRVERDGSRNAVTLLDFGIGNNGAVFVIDRTDPTEEARVYAADLGLDLTVPHYLMAIVNGETVDVFVDGELVFDDLEVGERDGVYGMSMVGRATPSPRCEARNFWVFLEN